MYFVRFVWAVAAFVLAAVMIGAGIAQRTIFQGPRTETASISVEEDAPYLLIDGAVLNQMPGTQTLRVQGEGDLFAAYGRAADVQAWLSDAEYNRVTVNRDGEVVTTLVEPEPVDPADAESGEAADPAATEPPATEQAAPGDETGDGATGSPGRNPVGSDLWLDEFQQSDILIAPLQLPEDMSVLVATDGTAAAPSTVSVSWPLQTTTPWAGPLIVGGGILMAIGVFLYILGIRHARRSRGPRRKGLPLPVTEPIDLAVDGADKGVISSSDAPTRRRAVTSGRRAFAVVPAVAVSALLFTGCAADAWPQFGATPTPTPTATVIAPEGQQAPAVTKPQAERILTRIASTIADADAAMDAELAATRLEGAALAARETNYRIRASLADYQAPAGILSKPLKVILPQAFDGWPRSVIAVADDSASKTSSIMLMTQQDAWSDYKLSYIASLEASTPLPDLAPAYIGATQVEPDSPFLLMAPEEIAAAYADVIDNGDVRRCHRQRRGERVLRCVRPGGRPDARQHRGRSPAAPGRVQPDGNGDGNLRVPGERRYAAALRTRYHRERRDRGCQHPRDRHRPADHRGRRDQDREQSAGQGAHRCRPVGDGIHHDVHGSGLLLRPWFRFGREDPPARLFL
ncbi:MAG: glycosyl transferase [Mycobacterium sp.]|nr:glycosyl transferase [Mycobacterium sp.]